MIKERNSIFYTFIFLLISLFFLFAIRNLQLGNSNDSRYATYTIRFEYFGMDANSIEREITIPLEEKLSCMSSLIELRSMVEYGKSVTTAFFDKNINNRTTYLEIRNYVDNLYNELPDSVQKPRIYKSDNTNKSVINIAISGSDNLNYLRTYASETLKPKIERIEGVAEVIVAGGTINEILIEFDKEKTVNSQLNPTSFGAIIQDANEVSSAGSIKGNIINQNIAFDTKLKDINEVKKLPVQFQNGFTTLEHLADIHFNERDNEEIVRINGNKCVSIQIISTYSGNSIYISNEVKKILYKSELNTDNYQILQDYGEQTYKITRNVIIALIEAFLLIVLLVPFFYKSLKILGIIFFILPVNILWTIGILHIFNLPVDQNTLSGISIALGLISDSTLIIFEFYEKTENRLVFIKHIKTIYKSIIASSITTILSLIPLYYLEVIVPGIKAIAVAITVMILNSTIIAIIFLPNFLGSEGQSKKKGKRKLSINTIRLLNRTNYKISFWSLRNKKLCFVLYSILFICPFVLFFVIEKNINLENNVPVLFATVEYESEKDNSAIDNEVNNITERITQIEGIKFVTTESKKGSCEIEIGYDESISRYKLIEEISSLGKYISEGFLYIPEKGVKKRNQNHQIEIAVIGDETKKCMEYCNQIVTAASKEPKVLQGVLNFKNPEQEIIIKPDIDYITKNGGDVSTVASQLRWILFGPVIDKWIQNGKEADIRIVGKNAKNTNLSNLENTFVLLNNAPVRLYNVGAFIKESSVGKIYRLNNRRCAYCTLSVNATSSENAKKITESILSKIEFEKGYGYQLSRDLQLMHKQYNMLFAVFLLCVVAIIIFLTGVTEDIIKTLLIISIIPVSLAFPLLYKFLLKIPLQMGDIVGMILVSGISVNNSIYILESKKSRVVFKVREKVRSITITSLTSILGAIPLVIMSTGSFAGKLALFMLLGIINSFMASVVFFPSLIHFYSRRVIKNFY